MKHRSIVASRGLLTAPEFGNAVAWSEDNVLACALGSSIYLVDPGDLGGPLAFISLSGINKAVAERESRAPVGTAAQDLLTARRQAYAATWPGLARTPGVRSLTWSGRGMAPQGGCLLCTVTCDHQVGAGRTY